MKSAELDYCPRGTCGEVNLPDEALEVCAMNGALNRVTFSSAFVEGSVTIVLNSCLHLIFKTWLLII